MSVFSKMTLLLAPLVGGVIGGAALSSASYAQQVFSTGGQTIGGPGTLTTATSTPTAVWQSLEATNICVSMHSVTSTYTAGATTVVLRPSGLKAVVTVNETTSLCATGQTDVFITSNQPSVTVYWRVDLHP